MSFHECWKDALSRHQDSVANENQKDEKCVGFYLVEEREFETGRARTRLTRLASRRGLKFSTGRPRCLLVFRVCTHLLLPLTVGFFFFVERLLLSFPPSLLWKKLKRGMADMIECNSRRTAFQLLTGFLPPVKRKKKKQKEIFFLSVRGLFFFLFFPF
jgi:hypothetical protein